MLILVWLVVLLWKFDFSMFGRFDTSSSFQSILKPGSTALNTPKNRSITIRILLLRLGVFILLACLVSAIGASSYFVLRASELKTFQKVFESSVEQVSITLNSSLKRKINVGKAINLMFGYAIQSGNIGTPPNITFPGYIPIIDVLTELSDSGGISFYNILTNKTRSSWEAYAKTHSHLLGVPDYLIESVNGSWTISDGIYMKTASGKKVRSPGYTSGVRFPHLITPCWQVTNFGTQLTVSMYDSHSSKARAEVIDRMIVTKTPGFTDIIQQVTAVSVRPSTNLYTPIRTLDKDEIIGFSATGFNWDQILESVLPTYIPGFLCVLSTSTQTYSFLVSKGKVQILGAGDMHDHRYSSHKKVITASLTSLAYISAADYTFTIYPTEELYNSYVTNMPGIVCGSFVASIVVTALVILLYDYFVQGRERILIQAHLEATSRFNDMVRREWDIKSSFVRYISHEVRTPLNIVTLGLKFLESEIKRLPHSHDGKLIEALEVLGDLRHSNDLAVEILDNLLTFEKLSSNILELYKMKLPLREYLEDCIRPSLLQAKEAGVRVNINLSPEIRESDHILIEIDKRKINQVVRNLLSNAIKFTPKSNEVRVNISIIPMVGSSSNAAEAVSVSGLPNTHRYLLRRNNSAKRNNASKIFLDLDNGRSRIDGDSHSFDSRSNYAVLRVEVIDQGIGISPENQKRLFKEIVHFTPGELQDGNGTGLSLWISHQIVTLHGGRLHMHSDGIGRGCKFTMDLPFHHTFRPPPGVDRYNSQFSSSSHSSRSVKSQLGENLKYHHSSTNGNITTVVEPAYLRDSIPMWNRDDGSSQNDHFSNSKSILESSSVCLESKPSSTTVDAPPPVLTSDLNQSPPLTPNEFQIVVPADEADKFDLNGNVICLISDGVGACKDVSTQDDKKNSNASGSISAKLNESSPSSHSGAVTVDYQTISMTEAKDLQLQPLDSIISTQPLSQPVDGQIDEGKEEKQEGKQRDEIASDSNYRVLVVDDVSMNRKMMIRIIRDRWSSITEAQDGSVAVDCVSRSLQANEPYDLILMDYQMPKMNGPEAARIIRNMGFGGLIIGVTGNGLPSDIEYFLSQGVNRVLLKPLDIDLLDQSLRTEQE